MNSFKSISKSNFIFLLAYGIYILSMTLEYTPMQYDFDRVLQAMRYLSYGLFLVKILFESVYRKKSTLLFAVLLVLFALQSGINGKRDFCFLILILFAFYGVRIKDALCLQIVIQMTCLMAVFLLCMTNILDNGEYYDHGQIRYTMGFSYVHGAGEIFFSSELAWLFIRQKKLTIGEVFAILAGWGVIFYYTDFKTMGMLGVAAVIACYLIKFLKYSIKKCPFKQLYLSIPLLMAGATWALQLYYNRYAFSDLMKTFNGWFNGRLNLAYAAIRNYGVHLLGSRIAWVGNTENLARNSYNYVDCAYIKLVMDYGIFIEILVLAVYCYIMYQLIKCENHAGCILVSAVLVCGFMLPVIYGVHYNPLLLLAGGIFHGKTEIYQT